MPRLYFAVCLILSAASAAPAFGVEWRDLTLDQAIAEAKEQNTMVLIDVWAEHCGSCGQMDIEVWNTPQGEDLVQGLIPIKIDSTSPQGAALSSRYPITGLPAIIFLKPDGTELDRVEGYFTKDRFWREVQPLKAGVDPLVEMEMALESSPDSLELLIQLMDKYVFRRRAADADTLFQRILRIDQGNHKRYAERAIVKMARAAEYVYHSPGQVVDYWKLMVEEYPEASSIGGAVDGVYKTWVSMGKGAEWVDWICGVLERRPQSPGLNRAAAYTAIRAGFRSPCLAQAARTARDLRVGNEAYLDSIASILEGKPK